MSQALTDNLPLFDEAQHDIPNVLQEAFDTISDAPNGIEKIRELILDLAV